MATPTATTTTTQETWTSRSSRSGAIWQLTKSTSRNLCYRVFSKNIFLNIAKCLPFLRQSILLDLPLEEFTYLVQENFGAFLGNIQMKEKSEKEVHDRSCGLMDKAPPKLGIASIYL